MRAFGAVAGRRHDDRLEPRPRLIRQDGLHHDFQAGALVQRGLLDLDRRGPVSHLHTSGKHPPARITDGVDVLRQITQKDHLGDDGPEVSTLGFEYAKDRAIDRFSLPARCGRSGGRPAMNEEFPRLGACDATDDDQASVRLDRRGNGMGRHFDSLGGDGSWLHARTVRAVSPPCREPVAARRP